MKPIHAVYLYLFTRTVYPITPSLPSTPRHAQHGPVSGSGGVPAGQSQQEELRTCGTHSQRKVRVLVGVGERSNCRASEVSVLPGSFTHELRERGFGPAPPSTVRYQRHEAETLRAECSGPALPSVTWAVGDDCWPTDDVHGGGFDQSWEEVDLLHQGVRAPWGHPGYVDHEGYLGGMLKVTVANSAQGGQSHGGTAAWEAAGRTEELWCK